ncbi:MAG: hypothetical protein F4039_00810 [Gammaproteobacteria bacterium]|nr:hypothetical protein [Gammaproteobacteria bacterium]MXX95492.1 hypothetical protein [Gammaproteobacteria bacterium]MYK42621.1 hypothetical protein [Gammaproteobacteria bacterium]
MDWETYKNLCNEPHIVSRWLLEHTAKFCDAEHARLLLSYLQRKPLEKPKDHKGTSEVDMFCTALTYEQVQNIVSFVVSTSSHVSKLSQSQHRGIELAWREYLQSFASGNKSSTSE